ncbi:MAG: bifunctional demethylmenaquinone methyltransferase/2-methoxy-6-polyprenyl-1,4-benzoquinol methylase UbiE [Chitinophagales bacterium]
MGNQQVVPYADSDLGKKEQIAKMFDSVAHRYDFLNRIMSFGIDHYWRWRAINQLKAIQPKTILDVATGTGDVAIATMRLKPEKIIGVDISEEMMVMGREKLKSRKMDKVIRLEYGDAENLQFADNTFDAITVAFGVRNFETLEKGLAELNRVLRPGGKLVILELTSPRTFPIKQLYNFYSKYILANIGKFFSKDNSAYTYLPNSIQAFPEGAAFLNILANQNFKTTQCTRLTLGTCSLYTATK